VVVSIVLVAVAFGGGLVGNAWGSTNREQLAKLLLKRDPGKRLGAQTLVGTENGARLRGVAGRTSFMMALGDREVLIGGHGHDELGAYVGTRVVRIYGGGGPDLIHGMGLSGRLFGGAGHDLIYGGPGDDVIDAGSGDDTIYGGRGNDTIKGGPGNDTIYGGRGNDTIRGGSGNDRIIAVHGDATVVTGPGRTLVYVRDRRADDRVICPSGGHTQVLADRGDRLWGGCRRLPATAVSMFTGLIPGLRGAKAAQAVSGDGSMGNPFATDCVPTPPTQFANCVEVSFASRTLTGLWANEYVPSYACPDDASDMGDAHTFLYNQNFAPGGTTVPNGVYVYGLGPIGVSITETAAGANSQWGEREPDLEDQAGQTVTGFPASSATNWTSGKNSYRLQLACTQADGNIYLASLH